MNDEILTVLQTADYLKISDKTVLKLIKQKKLVASLVGRIWRIKRSDINAYLAANSNGERGAKSR
jgi:excisionase family DNA binding protein